MTRRLLSTFLAIATFAVVWLVVSPASAATPSIERLVSVSEAPVASAVGTMSLLTVVHPDAQKPRSMAPLCDPRGAIGFAPPPQIQDAELSLDIPADCLETNPLETKNYVPGHRSPPIEMSSQEPFAQIRVTLPATQLSERLPVRVEAADPGPPGVRSSVERPPRS